MFLSRYLTESFDAKMEHRKPKSYDRFHFSSKGYRTKNETKTQKPKNKTKPIGAQRTLNGHPTNTPPHPTTTPGRSSHLWRAMQAHRTVRQSLVSIVALPRAVSLIISSRCRPFTSEGSAEDPIAMAWRAPARSFGLCSVMPTAHHSCSNTWGQAQAKSIKQLY